MKELPYCYGDDDCSTSQMSSCTFVGTCGNSIDGKPLSEAQAMKEAVTYWRTRADEYLPDVRQMQVVKGLAQRLLKAEGKIPTEQALTELVVACIGEKK